MQEEQIFAWIVEYWPYVITVLTTVVSIWAVIHVVFRKRDVRSALGWAGLILFSPGIGAILYFLFGINRVQRKAVALRDPRGRFARLEYAHALAPESLLERFEPNGEALLQIARAVQHVAHKPLLQGNAIQVLVNGEEAFPAMLEAIRTAKRSVTLVSYIFSADSLGMLFVEALAAAQQRGVAVRVLVDAVGVRYHMPSVFKILKRHGVQAALFIPVHNIRLFNLRTHRKICVVDGEIGFTGGMNLRREHMVSQASSSPTADVHFRLEGPIVTQLQEVFVEDWFYTTKERLRGEPWFQGSAPKGQIICRGIADGPDAIYNTLAWTMQAAISSAKRRIRIVTPYFIPDIALITALGVAATRGIEVDIVLPARGNLRLVQWASDALLSQVVSHGCRVWLSPAPFDHAKMMTVDGMWSLIGSTNWDTRSLRLNFEFNCEAYDVRLTAELDTLIEQRIAKARHLKLHDLESLPWLVQLRNGLARLLSPYL